MIEPHRIVRRSLDGSVNSLEAADLADCQRFDELLNRLFQQRGVRQDEPAVGRLADLLGTKDLLDLGTAVAVLADAVMTAKHIMVVGDYDADGATATALVVRALRAMGATQVSFLIPSRFVDGYGLSSALVDVARERGAQVIVTVDNGISSIDAVTYANQYDIQVVITDHHQAGKTLPNAAAVVNPNRPDCDFPSKHLAGVGVAFYVMAALRSWLMSRHWFRGQVPKASSWLDLVAVGTVADVVTLDANNRILVDYGLRLIRRDQCALVITALLKVAGRPPQLASSSDLGFAVAPRLNAAGRLEDMSLGVTALLSTSLAEANELATRLEDINLQRRALEQEMKGEADALAKQLCAYQGDIPPAFCFFQPDWHQGLIGLVAARLREYFNRPVAAFAVGDVGLLKGSLRSINGIHIRDVLARIDQREPGLIKQFGGHAMAAGLTLEEQRFALFSQLFIEEVKTSIGTVDMAPVLYSDGCLPTHLMNLGVAKQLRIAAPWGKDFPEPQFDGCFLVRETRILKQVHLRLELVTENGQCFTAIAFNLAAQCPEVGQWVRLVYTLEVNSFRGRESVQLMVSALSVLPAKQAEVLIENIEECSAQPAGMES